MKRTPVEELQVGDIYILHSSSIPGREVVYRLHTVTRAFDGHKGDAMVGSMGTHFRSGVRWVLTQAEVDVVAAVQAHARAAAKGIPR